MYPFAAALVAAWDTLAMSLQKTRKQVSVEYQDVHFFSQPTLHDQRNLRLNVSLHRGTGWFEVCNTFTYMIYKSMYPICILNTD